jgi:hypothetical protein
MTGTKGFVALAARTFSCLDLINPMLHLELETTYLINWYDLPDYLGKPA